MTLTYKWYRSGIAISDASAATYKLRTGDSGTDHHREGHRLQVRLHHHLQNLHRHEGSGVAPRPLNEGGALALSGGVIGPEIVASGSTAGLVNAEPVIGSAGALVDDAFARGNANR